MTSNSKFTIKTPGHDELSAAIQVVEINGKRVRNVRSTLRDEYNIDVRPMGSYSLNAIRVSLAIFNTKADIDYLVECMEKIADS